MGKVFHNLYFSGKCSIVEFQLGSSCVTLSISVQSFQTLLSKRISIFDTEDDILLSIAQKLKSKLE